MDLYIISSVMFILGLLIDTGQLQFLKEGGTCQISACDALNSIKKEISEQRYRLEHSTQIDDSLEMRLIRLDRRLRSVEQPVWRRSDEDDRWYKCCEGPCRCRPETFALSCWRQDLGELPSNQMVPKDIRVIDLGINQLSGLNKDAFEGLERLIELDLFDNRIDYLPSVIFDNLDSLSKLRLHRNRLDELHPKLFQKLPNLESLDISSNSIRNLPKELFQGTPRLILLIMSSNSLEELPANIFQNLVKLEELDISGNLLTDFPTGIFQGLVSLKRLRLSDNRIRQLPPGVFSDLKYLDFLSLRRNQLTFLRPALFDSLTHLTHLELSANWISTVSGQEFNRLISLKELHLGQNYIQNLQEGMFENCINLEKLFLFSNNIQHLQDGVFGGLSNLTTLLLNNNILKLIGDTVFKPLKNLKKLIQFYGHLVRMNEERLTYDLPQYEISSRNSDNWFIKIHEDMRSLNIAQTDLLNSQLDSNKFQFLPTDSFNYVPGLVSLKLAKNPWHCDCSILYLARWLKNNTKKVWDSSPTCRGPGDLGGKLVEDMTFDDLCDGQWASMVRLTPRIPVKGSEQQKINLGV